MSFSKFDFTAYSETEMQKRASDFLEEMRRRRSIRDFSSKPVPDEVITRCLQTAGLAQSGANLQPWHFAVVKDPAVKQQIRAAAEKEERAFYSGKAPEDWLEALAPLGTDADKPFLETAPVLIAIFQQRFSKRDDGSRVKHYYSAESVGIATGFLITALHHAGLACLTHTPSPMGFLRDILGRPRSERPFLLLVVGYPSEDAMVPDITRKSLEEIVSYH